ncbi:MAG: hypothetical protein E7345_02340 [Clostridiales bacterium]|nr:hypothetical protein [Clostridiales bacterium]
MNNLLNSFQTFLDSLLLRLRMPAIIVALACAIVAVALVMLARRIARAVRKSDNIQDNDTVLITLKAIGLVLLFISVLIIVFRI